MTIKLGYARVSTHNQRTDNQEAVLREAGCSEVFSDEAVSGSKNHRSPKYRALMDRARELRAQGEEVVVVVSKLDRFSRSMKALLEGVEELGEMGASFEALDGGFKYEANSPFSTLMLHILGALAEFERSLIVSRMAEGMEAKVAKGLRRGPKPKLTQAQVDAIRQAWATGTKTDAELAKDWKVGRTTIQRVLGIRGFEESYTTLDQWEAAKAAANV